MEWKLVLVSVRTAAVVLRLAIKGTVLWALAVFPLPGVLVVLAIQRLVSVVVQLPFPLYRRQTLPWRCPAVCVFWYSFQGSHDFLKQSAVLFARVFGRLTAQIPHCSCLTRRISNHLFLVNHRFEHFDSGCKFS